MTDRDRVRAFTLRLEGRTWREIGETLGYAEATVYQDLQSCLRRSTRLSRSVYPALAEVIRRDYGGCIGDFARACGIHRNIVYDLLKGRRALSPTYRQRICRTTGREGRELFERRKRDVHL